jgi:4-amino-4-deoxy-L-arabinose transferase-like glycosyltransferase
MPTHLVDRWYERPLAPALAIVLICGVAVLLRPEVPFRGMDIVEESRWESAQIAYSLFAGHGFSSPFHGAQTGPTAWFPPVYVWITAVLYRFFGVYTLGFMLAMRALNISLVALNAILVFRIADRCFGRRCAVFASWTWALLPYALLFAPGVLTIPFDPSYLLLGWYFAFSSFLMTLLFFLTLRLEDSIGTSEWILYGLTWGIGALSNPALLAFLPAAVWFLFRRRLATRSRIALAATVFIVLIAPWIIRNSVTFHRPTFIRDNIGAELRAGNCEWCEGQWFPAAYPALGHRELRNFVHLGEGQFIDIETRKAIDFISHNPGRFALLCFRRAIYFWAGPPLSSSRHPALSGFRNSLYLLSSLIAFAGLWLAYRNRNPYAGLFCGLLLLFPLVYYATFTTDEYRIPIEPLLLILSTYVLSEAQAPTLQRAEIAISTGS